MQKMIQMIIGVGFFWAFNALVIFAQNPPPVPGQAPPVNCDSPKTPEERYQCFVEKYDQKIKRAEAKIGSQSFNSFAVRHSAF